MLGEGTGAYHHGTGLLLVLLLSRGGVPLDGGDARVGEDGDVEVCDFFGLGVEPEAGGEFGGGGHGDELVGSQGGLELKVDYGGRLLELYSTACAGKRLLYLFASIWSWLGSSGSVAWMRGSTRGLVNTAARGHVCGAAA